MGPWQKYYEEDRRTLSAPPSFCARRAAELFAERGKRVILDLACGAGRDTEHLADQGLTVIGADLERAGVELTRARCNATLVQADAQMLPFANGAFEGIYCFGLLHTFTGIDRDRQIQRVMREIYRTLQFGGVLALAVLSGDFRFSLPDVYLFSGGMFTEATKDFSPIEIREYDDIGCTGRTNYKVWYGAFVKEGDGR